jgi:hypothetical protein
MKILIVDFWSITPHLETSFEIARKHIDKGDEVYYYFLGHNLPYSEFVKKKRNKYQIRRFLPERRAAHLLADEKFHYNDTYEIELVGQFSLINRLSYDELINIEYKRAKVGLSVASSLIHQLRDSNPNLNENIDKVRVMLNSAAMAFNACDTIIKEVSPNLAYVFNGRFVHYRSYMSACIANGVPYKIHERGSSIWKYSVRDFMPHDSDKIQDEIIDFWNTSDISDEIRHEKANEFFIDRRKGREQSWFSFRKYHTEGLLPVFDSNKKVITFFTSSDDEFKAVGDLHKSIYWPSQIDAIKAFIDICRNDSSIQGFLRIHPHINEKSRRDYEFWHNLPLPSNLTLLPSNSGIDSYSLLECSNIVLSSGSTIGVESSYWGTPSICLGPSFYGKLGCVYLPRSETELADLVQSDNLVSNKDACLPYGFYMNEFGVPYKHFIPEGLLGGKFMGTDLFANNALENMVKQVAHIYSYAKRKSGFV